MSDNATFDDLARHPDRHKGNYWHAKGEVIQSQQDGTFFAFRINVTENRYGNWEDTVYAVWEQQGNTRFLEDDIIEFVAILGGLHTYESILGASITLPFMGIERIYLVEEVPQSDSALCAFVQRNPSSPETTPDPSLAYANTNANLRAGPSTAFGLAGGLNKGDPVQPVARTIDGSWIQLQRGAWIYAPLLNDLPADLPIAQNIPPIPTPVATPTPESIISISIRDLIVEYVDNELRANAQYKGKLLETSGYIEEFDTTWDDRNYVELSHIDVYDRRGLTNWASEYRFVSLRCIFSETEAHKFLDLSKNDNITVIGRNEGEEYGDIILENCRLSS